MSGPSNAFWGFLAKRLVDLLPEHTRVLIQLRAGASGSQPLPGIGAGKGGSELTIARFQKHLQSLDDASVGIETRFISGCSG